MQISLLQFSKTCNFFTVIFRKFVHSFSQNNVNFEQILLFFQCYIVEFEQINADLVTLSIDVHKPFWLSCASIQFSKNLLLPELKLKLHGFHYVKITYVLFQRKRYLKEGILRCRSSRSQVLFKIFVIKNFAIFTVKYLRSPFLIKWQLY